MGEVYLTKEFRYNYTFEISSKKDFLWNTGNFSSYWFQVVGCCKDTSSDSAGSCPPFKTDDQKCKDKKSFYFQTILAYSVEDVCQQLTNNNWNWEICSVKKWSRPAENAYVLTTTDECNILQEVEFKDIPECISLSVSQKPEFNFKFKMSVAPVYVGRGSISLCKSGCSAVYGTSGLQLFDNSYLQDSLEILCVEEEVVCSQEENLEIMNAEESLPDMSESLDQLSSVIPNITVNCSQCTTLPARLYCKNNLQNLVDFSNFAYNSNQKLDSNFGIIYSRTSDSWNRSFHYTTDLTKWYIYFDLSCFRSTETDYYWKFLMLFKKFENSVLTDTKLAITVPSEYVCGYSSEFTFAFNFNVIKKYLFTNINYYRDDFMFYDKIGLFSNNYWKNNPELSIKITQSYDANNITRKTIV